MTTSRTIHKDNILKHVNEANPALMSPIGFSGLLVIQNIEVKMENFYFKFRLHMPM